MSNQDILEIYDRIPLPKSLIIPQRSRLYSLEPIAIRTPFIESISSYLTRLAQEHSLPLKKLIMGEIAPVILGDCGCPKGLTSSQRDTASICRGASPKDAASRRHRYQPEMLSKSVSSIFGSSDAKPAINGMRDKTRSLVDALEQLTLREDLRYLSCLTYQGVIKDRSLFRQNKVWCPQCFDQWRREEKPIHEPLLWSFKDVNYCLQHNSQLSDRCPHCDSPQKAIANHSRLGYCDRCKKWLGNNLNNEVEITDKDRQIIIGIGELIATAPILDFPLTLPDIIPKLKLIQFSFERSLRQDLTQFVSLGKTIEQLKIAIVQHPDKPLNLVTLLIPVCNLANVSIAQFLQKDISTLGKMLGINFNNQIQKTSHKSSLTSMFNL